MLYSVRHLQQSADIFVAFNMHHSVAFICMLSLISTLMHVSPLPLLWRHSVMSNDPIHVTKQLSRRKGSYDFFQDFHDFFHV